MSQKKRILLRLDPLLHAAIRKWAADELRSVNAQIEFLLAAALRRAGRLVDPDAEEADRDSPHRP